MFVMFTWVFMLKLGSRFHYYNKVPQFSKIIVPELQKITKMTPKRWIGVEPHYYMDDLSRRTHPMVVGLDRLIPNQLDNFGVN